MKLNTKATLILSTVFAAALTSCGPKAMMPAQMMPAMVKTQQAKAQLPSQLLVRFKGQFTMNRARVAEFNAKYGLHIREFVPSLNVYLVDVDTETGLRPEKMVAFLQNDPMVEMAEVNHSVQVKPVATDMQIMPIR